MKRRKNNKLFRTAIAFLLAIGCCTYSILPVSAVKNSEEKHSVKIGAFTSSGYHHKTEDGSIDGYGYEYEMLLAQYANWDVTYVEGSWTQLQEMLANGEIDLLGFLVSTSERQEIYDYADYASGKSHSSLIVGKDNLNYKFDEYDTFDGMKIAYQEKNANIASLINWSEEKGINITTIPCQSYEEVFEQIDSGKADAGLATNFYDISNYKIVCVINTVEFYYAVKKGNSQLLTELNNAIQDIDTYYPNIETTLYRHYFSNTNGRGESFTSEELEYLQTQPTVTVLAGGREAPYEIWDQKTGTYTGFIPDVLEQISEVTGLEFQYQHVESKTEYSKEHPNENIISSMTSDVSWAQKNKVKITEPIINANTSLITKDKNIEIHTVALGNENYLKHHIEQSHPTWTIITYDTVEQCLNAVFTGKCDATLMNSYEADYYMSTGKYHLLHEQITTDISQNIGFGVSPGSNPLLFGIMSKAILMLNSDTYIELMNDNLDYSGTNDLSDLIYTNPTQVMRIITLIIIVFAVLVIMIIYTMVIRKKNKEITAATQVKTDFFSRMSHDMRTPMNGILGMTALSKEEQDPTVLHRNMEQIEESGKYMLSLINDTLDMQKLESGKMKLDSKKVYAKDYFENLVKMMKPTAEAKGISFEYENINANLECYVKLDPVRIKQIFANVLSNAIKFTPKGGMVRFTAECIRKDGSIEYDKFCVQDTGIGMSEEFVKNRLFQPYSQEDSSITSKYGGTGLGLAITKNLIEAMGGTISVESTLGEGSCFTVFLSFETSPVMGESSKVNTRITEKRKYDSLNAKKILLCEDHPLNAEISKRLLQKVGCEVVLAEDGKIGVEKFEESKVNEYDVVLMDLRMPNMDGLTAARIIRSLNRTDAKTVPIIAMTANASSEDRKACLDVGMNDHISKPIDVEDMYKTIEKYLS